MEKVLSKQPGSEGVKSDKVLELNVNHPCLLYTSAVEMHSFNSAVRLKMLPESTSAYFASGVLAG